MDRRTTLKWALAAASLYLLPSTLVHAHGIHRGIPNIGDQPVDWHTGQITRVMTFRGEQGGGQVVTLDEKKCLAGAVFYFDVDERFAFDIDETVQLEVQFYRHREATVAEVSYKNNVDAETTVLAEIPGYKDGPRAHKVVFSLEHARFSNRGLLLSDFSIGSGNNITICNIDLKRTYTTVVPKDFGDIAVEVSDETGKPVPARVGIYDKTGRLPLPSEEAIAVKSLNYLARVVNINPQLIPWPASNPSGFYVNGSYHAKLPVGQYELVAAKGPEYRFFRQSFKVESDRTRTIKINLKRWDNLPAKGWYSGDNHIHYIRHNKNDDQNLLVFTQAEDLHVANILQVGNIATVAWPQYGWQTITASAATEDDTYCVVPGQEDPRTNRRGHTISLHLKEPIRDAQRYLLYHEAFEKARTQGGVTGYAHVVGHSAYNSRAGLALDVPFGLVDFVEVMQFGYAGSNPWFDFLNLGYKVAPSAGTDYGADGTLPGAERSYVHVQSGFSVQGWFDAFKRGETFVTNGPMLELTVNGRGMGSEVRLKAGDKLVINAAASINPDIDSLKSLELIEQGEIVKAVTAKKTGTTKLQLHHEATAQHGTWFVIRAQGNLPHKPKNPMPEWETNQDSAKIALSGAVYVYVDSQGFWKPSAVPSIVQRMKRGMENLLEAETGDKEDVGARETSLTLWEAQKPLLERRMDQVMSIYDDLVERAKAESEK